jgi:hypothetical protein
METALVLQILGYFGVSAKDWIANYLTLIELDEWTSKVPLPLEHLK